MTNFASCSHTAPHPGPTRLMEFCEGVLFLNNKPVRFPDRPYLDAIYDALEGNVIIRAGRQVEKSAFISFRMAFELARRPGTRILLVCPRQQQAKTLMADRFLPLFNQSVLLRHLLHFPKGQRTNTETLRFANGSQLYVRSAFTSADAARGITADILIVDEYQDIAPHVLPVLRETLSHAENPRMVLTGTSKDVANHLEDAYAASTACAWTVTCRECGTDVIPDERSVTPDLYRCWTCHEPIDWRLGRWVASNPASRWGSGFWLSQVMAPWMTPRKFHDKATGVSHDKLLNESFGLPTTKGTLAITRAELEACCSPRTAAKSSQDIDVDSASRPILAVDWGSGAASQAAVVVASPCRRSQRLRIWYWGFVGGGERSTLDEVAMLCQKFAVSFVFADARGGGAHHNRMLWGRLGHDNGPTLVGIEYGDTDAGPSKDGTLQRFCIDRTKWIAGAFARIKDKLVEFPQSADCQEGFAHAGSEQIDFDEQSRRSVYRAAEGRADDLLHPLVYALAGWTKFCPPVED